jgi:hypothetical protein
MTIELVRKKRLFDKDEIRKALATILEPRAVFEVRALDAQLYRNRRIGTVSGYFDNADACLSELEKLTTAKGIYFTLNTVDPALLTRRVNRLEYVARDDTTKDQHIKRRRWLLVDVDAERPSGISATAEEKGAAHKKAREIHDYLKGRGWHLPVVADSGNGYHLLYRVDLPCDDGKVLEQVLAVLADCFDGDGVKIDRSVHNPARIGRLYGTLAAKGDTTQERPHRMSKILLSPLLAKVTAEKLQALVDELQPAKPLQPLRRKSTAQNNGKPDKEQVRAMLAAIPKRPDYADWIKIVAAVGDALSDADAIEVLNEWSPQENPGEYPDKLQQRLGEVHIGSLIHLAREHGWTPACIAVQAKGDVEPVELPPAPVAYVSPPLDLFPDGVQRFIRAGAETFDVDPAFFTLPTLSGAAATIGNARSIRLKADHIEPSILWSALIAPTGDSKSPTLKASTAPVEEREKNFARMNKENAKAFAKELAKWEAKGKKERGEKPEKPVLLTCLMDDATIEAVAYRLKDNPRGIELVKDELSHWFESMDQYHDRGGADVSRWLSLWLGGLFALDRVTADRSYRIPNPRLSIYGGIVPEVFKRCLTDDYFERGLPARFLFAMPTRNRPNKWIDKSIPSPLKEKLHELFKTLAALQPHYAMREDGEQDEAMPVLLGLSAEAKKIFVDFFNECSSRKFEASPREAAQWSKLSAYSARLALVGQLMWDPKADVITGEVMRAACDLARWFGLETERIYTLIGETDWQRDRRKLLEFIERRDGEVTERDVYSNYRPFKNKAKETAAWLDQLVRNSLGKWVPVPPTAKGGQPTRKFCLFRPPLSAQLPIFTREGRRLCGRGH